MVLVYHREQAIAMCFAYTSLTILSRLLRKTAACLLDFYQKERAFGRRALTMFYFSKPYAGFPFSIGLLLFLFYRAAINPHGLAHQFKMHRLPVKDILYIPQAVRHILPGDLLVSEQLINAVSLYIHREQAA